MSRSSGPGRDREIRAMQLFQLKSPPASPVSAATDRDGHGKPPVCWIQLTDVPDDGGPQQNAWTPATSAALCVQLIHNQVSTHHTIICNHFMCGLTIPHFIELQAVQMIIPTSCGDNYLAWHSNQCVNIDII